MDWGDACKFGSCWTTVMELEFHHVMRDPAQPEDPAALAPFPSDAVNVPSDDRSGFLVWLNDGAPAHARWCVDTQNFKRIGNSEVLERASVRAWAPIPFPVAKF